MRFLFTCAGGSGHLDPLVPVARAAEAAGHDVAFAMRPWMVAEAAALGFVAFDTGGSGGGADGGGAGGPRGGRSPLAAPDPAREARDFRDGFAGRIARERVGPVVERCRLWRPDALVCDETDFGALVAAERLGLRYATVVVLAAGTFARSAGIAGTLDAVRATHGLPPDPALSALDRYLVLSPVPPGFRDPGVPPPATLRAFRPDDGDARTEPPRWLADLSDGPRVYATLGTVFDLESGDLFDRMVAGLRELPATVVVTVGRRLDPAVFGPQPPNVHIVRYLPQDLILPHCDVVVSHAGSGSVLGALRYGRPMVLLPIGADQPDNAARCAALGVARVLDPVRATPAAIRDAVAAVLADPDPHPATRPDPHPATRPGPDGGHRAAAGRLAREAARLPGPGYAVRLLERLVGSPGR